MSWCQSYNTQYYIKGMCFQGYQPLTLNSAYLDQPVKTVLQFRQATKKTKTTQIY